MKRICSIVLTLCMLLAMPVAVQADEESGYIVGRDDVVEFGDASEKTLDDDSGTDRTAPPEKLTVKVNGVTVTRDALEIVARVVQKELGEGFREEAVKAQAVAAFTFIAQSNSMGGTPTVYLADKVSPEIEAIVSTVIGEAVYYKQKLAFTPYHATSAGSTTSSKSVWGGSYPYLVAVESSPDETVKGYKKKVSFTSDEIARRISEKLGIEVSGDPEQWIEIRSYTDGGYIDGVSIGGETKSRSGSAITGRLLRESVFGLRSACFDFSYDADADKFTFTTYGYGHGVGMSQNGANAYAGEGWDYIEILEHYYPGTTVI